MPNIKLEEIIEKVSDYNAWKTFIIFDATAKVLGGCVLREHPSIDSKYYGARNGTLAELYLMAIRPECQAFGLERCLCEHIKVLYSQIAAFTDSKTRIFFVKMGFQRLSESRK